MSARARPCLDWRSLSTHTWTAVNVRTGRVGIVWSRPDGIRAAVVDDDGDPKHIRYGDLLWELERAQAWCEKWMGGER